MVVWEPPSNLPAPPTIEGAQHLLRSVWGLNHFRNHQRRAIAAVLSGRDTLAVLPTGGGKSLCYQLPALLRPGLTVVVSPLISLMQDQVAGLRGRGISAAYLGSGQRPQVQAAVWNTISTDRLTILYVAPERLRQLVERRVTVTLLAVDEAHCISEWGHDFRPHFRAIGRRRRALGHPPTIAVTATATPETRADIVRVLELTRPVTIVRSFDRPNLFLGAQRSGGEAHRIRTLATLLRSCGGTAIAYVPTRNRADGLAAILRQWGFDAAPYHAGLPTGARRALLARFLSGRITVMAATSAFGMGIDKPDVRLVAHLGVPQRPEAYYQQAGRAGRDGLAARCVLLWLPRDLELGARLALGPRGRGPRKTLQAARAGLETMRRYATTARCRRRVLLAYLGERPDRCAGCDRCCGWPPLV